MERLLCWSNDGGILRGGGMVAFKLKILNFPNNNINVFIDYLSDDLWKYLQHSVTHTLLELGTCPMSCVTCHMSRVTCHMSLFKKKIIMVTKGAYPV